MLLRDTDQGHCAQGRHDLRLSQIQTQDTGKKAVMLQRITLQLTCWNPRAPNQGEHPQDQSLPDRQVQAVNLKNLRDTTPANDEKEPPVQDAHTSPLCRQEERHSKQSVETDCLPRSPSTNGALSSLLSPHTQSRRQHS